MQPRPPIVILDEAPAPPNSTAASGFFPSTRLEVPAGLASLPSSGGTPHGWFAATISEGPVRGDDEALWLEAGPQRQRVAGELLGPLFAGARGTAPELAVFGAEDGRQLGLAWLLGAFQHLTLLSSNVPRLHAATIRQGVSTNAQLTVASDPFERQVLDWWEEVLAVAPDEGARASALPDFHPVSAALPRAQVVASLGALPRLIGLLRAEGASRATASALLRLHMTQLLAATKPGGTVVVLQRLADARELPELAELPDSRLFELRDRHCGSEEWPAERNPFLLASLALGTPEGAACRCSLSPPWRALEGGVTWLWSALVLQKPRDAR